MRHGGAGSGAADRLVEQDLRPQGIRNEAVLKAIRRTPRHLFVPDDMVRWAYDDRALPIGRGQTISQPYIVALMTELLAVEPGYRVLEIGTGCGYQAAVLAELGVEVYTVEIVADLAEEARERLQRLGYGAVHCRAGDGYHGWPEHAPYDAVIVTCAAEQVPPPLIEQLREGGRLILPLGRPWGNQDLWVGEKRGGKLDMRRVTSVVFVPMTGGHEERSGAQQ